MKQLLALALAAVLAAEPQEKKLRVVTTLPFLAHLARRVGGDRVTATALAQPTRDPHTVQADPIMQRLAGESDLFVYVGRGLDLWARDIIQGSGNPRIQKGDGRVEASKDCTVLELPRVISREWGDVHPEGNPHHWLDPFNAEQVARNIAAALAAIDPSGRADYEANLKAFLLSVDEAMFGKELVAEEAGEVLWRKLRLGKLAEYLKEEGEEAKLGGWMARAAPLRGVKVISYHKTFVYFAERFGFDIAGELEEKPGIAPPPKHLEATLDLVRREGVKLILNDVFYPTTAADYVASRTGAKVCVVPIDVGGAEGADTYERLVGLLLDRMVEGLK